MDGPTSESIPATLMRIELVVIKELLGHAHIGVTATVYAHVRLRLQRDAPPRRPTASATNHHPAPTPSADIAVDYCRYPTQKPRQGVPDGASNLLLHGLHRELNGVSRNSQRQYRSDSALRAVSPQADMPPSCQWTRCQPFEAPLRWRPRRSSLPRTCHALAVTLQGEENASSAPPECIDQFPQLNRSQYWINCRKKYLGFARPGIRDDSVDPIGTYRYRRPPIRRS